MTTVLRNICLLLLLALLLPMLFLAQGPVFTTGQWVADLNLTQARTGACTAILADGRMLVTGGVGSAGALTSAEFLGSGTAAPMGVARSEHLCVTLLDGRV
ncbi:MAG TPA: hypothetical protein VE958_09065, partial [Bryobacteraceae bacterium]|nr:hypothetical protein [Bryobacteraceae bacterium]